MTVVPWDDRVRRRLKLRDVDVLLAVVQTGSMGKAGGVLRMSQPAVSKAIASLEQTLGVPLLERSRRGVEPTPYGLALIKRGVTVFDELRQGVQDIAFLTDPTVGDIRVGGTDGMISTLISPVVHQLSTQYPRMTFRVSVGDLRTLYRELEARRVDVVVSRLLHSPPSEEYSAEILYEDTMVVVAGASHPLARRRKIEIAELLDETWTFQPPETNFGAFAIEAFRAIGLAPPRITVATTSHTLHNELLATGRYLVMVPRLWALQQRPNPAIKILPVTFPHTRHKVAIITLKNRSLSSATRFFIDRVRATTKAVNQQSDRPKAKRGSPAKSPA
ncbi:MAG TPA: LysR family transcriptional regulator [Xanthobacteraceae bacterium]|nr:LysR family transcriptional regulator [Xanthobacteraceae bacterium]